MGRNSDLELEDFDKILSVCDDERMEAGESHDSREGLVGSTSVIEFKREIEE